MEAGLRTVGVTSPEQLASGSVENISFFIFEDKFQQALAYDKAFSGRNWG